MGSGADRRGHRDDVDERLLAFFCTRLGVDSAQISFEQRLDAYGLDSLRAGTFVKELSEVMGRPLPITLLWDYPTLRALSRHLSETDTLSAPPVARLTSTSAPRSDEPIAIVGMACRFPGAPDPESLWRMLREETSAITAVPPDRWDAAALYDPDRSRLGKMSTRWGGFLDRIDTFDAAFFGISPREAVQMDPLQRLLLELAWEALEDAGIAPERLHGTATGVFCGVMSSDYAGLLRSRLEEITQHTATGQDLSIVAARISYVLGLQGPSLAVNTACSSSLVAVHLACQSLRSGECEVALAGGGNLIITPDNTVAMSRLGAMSPSGRCKAFDAGADGYVRSEGAGLVVLKRLSLALDDGDRIYCVVRGSAVNNDGFSNGLTAPNPLAQEAVLRSAYERAGVRTSDVQFVETHGTGTRLGDPIEARSLGNVLGAGRAPGRPLLLGSLKTNLGHLEVAAGVAGLIKTALAVERRTIPANLNFEVPNPSIPFEALNVAVVDRRTPWPAGEDEPAVAGVSSFGFGGTNCHVVVSEPPPRAARLLLLSAESPASLVSRADELASRLDASRDNEPTLLCGAEAPGLYRRAIVFGTRQQLREQLADRVASAQPCASTPRGKLVLVFSGNGAQRVGMGRALLQTEPVFRAEIERCSRLCEQLAGWSMLAELRADDASSRIRAVDVAQPMLFALQIGLASLCRFWGIEADAVVGHSVGEIAAAHTAGALDLEDALRVVIERSRLQQRVAGQGTMLLVALSPEDAQARLSRAGSRLVAAAFNGPLATVLAGAIDDVDAFLADCKRDGIACRRVPVDVAYHSEHMDLLVPELVERLGGLRGRRVVTPIVSTVTGNFCQGDELEAHHWARNMRAPVLFSLATARLLEAGYDTFLELGPHPTLLDSVRENAARAGLRARTLSSIERGDDESRTLSRSVGALFEMGWPVDARPEQRGEKASPRVFPLSARSPAALDAQARRLVSFLRAGERPRFEDLCHTAARRRGHHDHRLSVAAASTSELLLGLTAFLDGEAPTNVRSGRRSLAGRSPLVFVCSPQGPVWWPRSRAQVQGEAALSAKLEECEEILSRWVEWSLIEQITTGARMKEAAVAQPVLTAMQIGVAALWRARGVTPDAVVGHSLGEIAAAHIAGHLDVEDALRVAFHRGRLIDRVRGTGAMAFVALSHAEAGAFLAERGGGLSVAADNGPRSVVLSGDRSAIDDAMRALAQRGTFARRLESVDFASHSALMDDLSDELVASLHEIQPRSGAVPMYSTVTGRCVEAEDLGPAYWGRNLRETVLFRPVIDHLLEHRDAMFVEISPHPSLCEAIDECARARGRAPAVLSSLCRDVDAGTTVAIAMAGLYAAGRDVDLAPPQQDGGRFVRLPSYAWQRERFWLDLKEQSPSRGRRRSFLGRSLASSLEAGVRYWEIDFSSDDFPYLKDHVVDGAVVLPAAAYVEVALEIMAEVFGDGSGAVERLHIVAPLVLRVGAARCAQLALVPGSSGGFHFKLASRAPDESGPWTLHAYGDLARRSAVATLPREDLAIREIQRRCGESSRDGDAHYASMRQRRLDYGPAFQRVEKLWRGRAEALARLTPADEAGSALHGVAPPLVDACLQALVALVPGSGTPVPVGLAEVRLDRAADVGEPRFAYATLAIAASDGELSGDAYLLDEEGRTILEARGVQIRIVAEADPASVEDLLHETKLEPRSLPRRIDASRPITADRWLVFAGEHPIARGLVQHLGAISECVVVAPGERFEALGGSRFTVNPARPEDLRALFDATSGAGVAPWRGVVHLWSLEIPPQRAGARLDEALDLGCAGVVHLVNALDRGDGCAAPRLWLVTQGARLSPEGLPVAVEQAPLWGLGRTLFYEAPELRCTLVDVGPSLDAAVRALLDEIVGDSGEREVILHDGARYVARLARADAAPARAAAVDRIQRPRGRAVRDAVRLESRAPGVLDQLVLRPVARRPPGREEIEIRVSAMGLNFLNVMSAMGVYPGHRDGVGPLGLECAGTIVACGPGVEDLAPGDEVVAISAESCGSFAIARRCLTVRRPPQLDAYAAATLPIAFVTAEHALVRLAGLARGERVLIHAAAGGVGHAAIAVAEQVGAVILATAGEPFKRDYLRSRGIEHVMDSRTLAFADEVRARTRGEGVDVVLNCLAGDAIAAGLSVLREGGRFVELGKRDIYERRPLDLGAFARNLSFFSVDLERMIRERPALVGALFHDVIARVREGSFGAIPSEVFPIARAAEAFRHMAQGKHVGKIVLTFGDDDAAAAVTDATRVELDPAGSYLITGGLGGLGLLVARWMVERGARHLVLLGRTEPSSQASRVVEELRARGVEVVVALGDVSREAELRPILDRISPPLRGVVHAAGVLADGTLPKQSRETLRTVMAPKVDGAYLLHELTLDRDLDLFVLFSSALSVLGSPGQGNYAAANAFLDALAEERGRVGLPCLVVNWGPWSSVGLASARGRGGRLESRGLGSISPEQGLRALERLLSSGASSAVVMAFEADAWTRSHPQVAGLPLFEQLGRARPEEGSAEPRPDAEDIQSRLARETSESRRINLLDEHVKGHLGRVLGLAPGAIERDAPLRSIGVDSLMTLEIRNRLERTLGMRLPTSLVWNYPTVAALTRYLLERIEAPEAASTPALAEPRVAQRRSREEAPADMSDLSEEELDTLLKDEISSVLGGA